MAKKKIQHEVEAEASGVEPRSELVGGPRDDEPKKRSGRKKRREGGSGGPRDDEPKKRREGGGGSGVVRRDDEPKKRSGKKKRREGGGGSPRDDEPKKRSGQKRRREGGGGGGGVPRDDEPKKRREGGGGPRDDEPKKRSGKKRRREGGGGKSGSIVDNAQSYELATRVAYQVLASPLKIQEMEKPNEPYYDVFLSFRGSDTRNDITDYLYHCLTDARIRTFRDNEELHVGEEIGPELLHAIKQSKILIPIFSKGYAASKWCLMELAQMVECKEKWGQKIIPIFYDVEPRMVRKQTGTYGHAIQSHINENTDKTIRNWKAALNKVGKLKGCELNNRGKGEFTKEVVYKVLFELKKSYLGAPDCLVEMDDQVDKIMEVIGEDTSETKIIGIHGMGGVGKTTLARIVYIKLSANFDCCCFLSDIRHTRMLSLQNQLISYLRNGKCLPIHNIAEGITEIKKSLSFKKVLLVLDDVHQKTELDALVGMGKCWLGRGSKVIITTRNKEVLNDVDLKHELSEMDFDHSLLLFSKHAFRRDHPPAEYIPLSKRVVKVCGRLPLALVIIGSFLDGRDIKFWETTLGKLGTNPDKNVEKMLNISIEALEPYAKEIFLDVCCFCVGFDVRIVKHMWESCRFCPDFYLDVLQQKSLIKIKEHDQLWVHDIVRDLGRDFVRQDGNHNKQSRVWDHEQAIDVLDIKEGRENVEALSLKYNRQFQDFMEMEESVSLPNLRFLQVDCVDSDENNGQHFPSTNWVQRNPIMLPKLRWLSWHNFPIFFKFTARSLKKLVILDLSRSKISDEWEGWNHLKTAENLKVLNLTDCGNLLGTFNFYAHQQLEQLILQGCTELVQVDRSIGKLKHLVSLNLKGCEKLKILPKEMEELEALTELFVGGTSITKIPEWKGMEKLETLNAANCELLSECNLAGCSKSLSYLDLSYTGISELPFGNFESLVELKLDGSNIRKLPNSIKTMKKLRVLDISETSIKKLPSALWRLDKLEEILTESCSYLSGEMPSEIGNLPFLRSLSLSGTNISNIPKLPESMTTLYLFENVELRCPDLSNLLNLRFLNLKLGYQSPSDLTRSLNWIGRLGKLEGLWLGCECDSMVTLPPDFNLLSKLRRLELIVNNLECLSKLPQNLSSFHLKARWLMQKSINLSYLEKLSVLSVRYCEQLTEIQGLESLKNLKILALYELPSLVKLPDFTGLKKLRRLLIEGCQYLLGVQGQLESLESLHIASCKSVVQLPDPLSFKHMKELIISNYWKLREIQGLEVSENLRVLMMDDFPLLEKLPDLTNAKKLKHIELTRCPRLVEIRGRLNSVVFLVIDHCESLRRFSDPSSFKKLEALEINKCERLEEILESDEYRDLKKVRRPFRAARTIQLHSSSEDSAGGWTGTIERLDVLSLIRDDPERGARPEPAATDSDVKERDGEPDRKSETRFDQADISLRGPRPGLPARRSVPRRG